MKPAQKWQFFLIFFLYLGACIETDLFLPALPDMMKYFSIDAVQIQRVLSVNYLTICISGLLIGPISDSMGRKPTTLFSLVMFCFGSLITAFTSHFPYFLFGRFVQGLGAGGIFTLGTAIIGDLFVGMESLGARNALNSLLPLVTAAAPMIGSRVNASFGFRWIFLIIGFLALTSFILSWFFLKETLPVKRRTSFQLIKTLKLYQNVATQKSFWSLALTGSLLSAGYLVFNTQIAILFMTEFGVKSEIFPWYQGTILFTYVIGSLGGSRLVKSLGTFQVKKVGTVMLLIGVFSLIVLAWMYPKQPTLITASMLFYVLGYVWIQMLYYSELLQLSSEKRGTVSSLRTGTRLLTTAVVFEIAARTYNSTILPTATLELVLVLSALLLMLIHEKLRVPTTNERRVELIQVASSENPISR